MAILENILSQEIVQRLGWTLIHSLWQGLAVVMVLAIALMALRKQSANLRYLICCLALAVIVALPVVTMQMIDVSAVEIIRSGPIVTEEIAMNGGLVVDAVPQLNRGEAITAKSPIAWKEMFVGWLEVGLPYMVVGWFVGVFGLSVWHLGGWAQLQRLKRQMIKPVSKELGNKLRQLAGKFKIYYPVKVVQSAIVNTPAVIGWLKPVILLPASALTGLTAQQLEAILAHELAHIKRCDYLVNLLQTAVEILGFYHPAVWWVSHKIRIERENCCDDMAVSVVAGRASYARALTSMEEIRGQGLALAVAASGGSLFDRIRRLIGKDSMQREKAGWLPSVIAIMLITGLIILTSCALISQEKKAEDEPVLQKSSIDKSYIPATSTINEQGHIVDKIDWPFVNDPQVIGTWESVDVVGEMEQFKVSEQQWQGRGGELFLNEMIFVKNGRLISKYDKVPRGYRGTWTNGLVIYNNDTKTASKYTLKDMDGSTYMFYEWKSGDYTFRHRKPSYYVLKKVSSETGGLAEGWASQPSDAEFAKQLPARIERLDIDTANLEQVKEIFGKPAQYVWSKETFTEDNLPRQYILLYPSGFFIYMRDNQIVEIRHESGSHYVFRDKIRFGSTLDEVFEVIGHPEKIVEGEKIGWVENVLYKDIDGRKGYCYYHHPDQNVRLWFRDYKIIAIYMTRSDYNAGRRGKVREKVDIPPTSTINEKGHIVDKVDWPFVNDPEVLGGWKSVDFVRDIKDFHPTKKSWVGDLFLNHLIFKEDGSIAGELLTWTKGLVLGEKTASKYIIKEIDGLKYMFFEWKSGDYTYRYRKPKYYVLEKVLAESVEYEPMIGKKANIPPTSKIDADGRIIDKIDWPFVDDPRVIGMWESVDFVDEIEQFDPSEKQWKWGELFLKELVFDPGGKTPYSWQTWTKGLVCHLNNKTASKYVIKDMDGQEYMFFEWKSGDYTYRYRKPKYYVLKKVESEPIKRTDVKVKKQVKGFKQRLVEPVTVHIDHSPDNDRLSVQYAVMAICKAAGVPYNWDKSAELADPQRRYYIDPVNIENNTASQAIADMVGPIGLLYGVDANGVYLYQPEKAAKIQSNLEINNIELEPVAQGKNILYATVKNTSDMEQLFAIGIYTRSVDYGPHGVGWGTRFFEKIKPNETKRTRFAYKIQGPVTENTYIRVKFYNPATEKEYNYEKPFTVRVYKSSDLPKPEIKTVTRQWTSEEMSEEIFKTFKHIQTLIKKKDYEKAWKLFTEDYQKSEYQSRGFEGFKFHMEPENPLHAAFHWDKKTFVKLKRKRLEASTDNLNDRGAELTAEYKNKKWTIYFVYDPENNKWKIDDILGYRPGIFDIQKEDAADEAEESKALIEIGARFIDVVEDCNEVAEFLKKEGVMDLSTAGMGEPNYSNMLDDEQVNQLLKLVHSCENSKILSAPKVTLLDGEFATVRTQRTIRYTKPGDEIADVKVGTIMEVTPTLRDEGKKILLEMKLEHSDLIGFETQEHNGKSYKIPIIDLNRIKTNVLIANGKTFVIGGSRKVSYTEEGNEEVLRGNLLILVKAEHLIDN